MKSKEYDGLHEYDFEALARAFEIFRATGQLPDFLKHCRDEGSKIYMKATVAKSTAEKLTGEMPALRSDRDRFVEIFGAAPEAVRHGDCPACPYH